MLVLRKETDLAVQLLKRLTKSPGKYLSLQDFAKEAGISFLFLQKIARKLRLGKLIVSAHGMKGGYKLAMPANKINLKKIMDAMDDHCQLTPCAGTDRRCEHNNKYCITIAMTKLNKELNSVLAKVGLPKM